MNQFTKQRILYNTMRRRFRHQFKGVFIPLYHPQQHDILLLGMLRFCARHQEAIRQSNHPSRQR